MSTHGISAPVVSEVWIAESRMALSYDWEDLIDRHARCGEFTVSAKERYQPTPRLPERLPMPEASTIVAILVTGWTYSFGPVSWHLRPEQRRSRDERRVSHP